jgi:hypothetical protein
MLYSLLHAPALEFEIEEADGHFVATVAVSETGDGSVLVTLDCWLYRIPDTDSFEFVFEFAVTSPDGTIEEYSTQNREIVLNLVMPETRPHILPTVCNALEALVEEVHPSAIYRVTKSRNLPEKALIKHNLITSTLQSMGYEIAESGTDRLRRRFWVMRSSQEGQGNGQKSEENR